jgi:hypothetical protein
MLADCERMEGGGEEVKEWTPENVGYLIILAGVVLWWVFRCER